MRLVYFDNFRLGLLVGQDVIDVSSIVSAQKTRVYPEDDAESFVRPADLATVVREWPVFRPLFEGATKSGIRKPLASVRLRQPVPRPVNIDCMAMNFIEDGSGNPPAPINAFHKSPDSLIGPDGTMVMQDVPGSVFEAEGEMALIVSKRGHNIPAAEAMDYVFGYTNLIDGSVRGLGPERNNFYMMKSRDTFCCLGPSIVTADEIPDVRNLNIRLWNNGELMQDFNTRDMAYSIARCIEFVSTAHTINPGDIIALGTNHQGLHPVMDGDLVELEVEGLGHLRLNVRDDLKRIWKRETRAEYAKTGRPGWFGPQLGGKYAPRK